MRNMLLVLTVWLLWSKMNIYDIAVLVINYIGNRLKRNGKIFKTRVLLQAVSFESMRTSQRVKPGLLVV